MLTKVVEYTTVEGTKASIAANKIVKIERQIGAIDPRTGQTTMHDDGRPNNAILNEMAAGRRAFTMSWMTVFYTGPMSTLNRNQTWIINDYEEFRDYWNSMLSSYRA